MKKILSIFAVAATLFTIASCNTKPSPEAVEAAAVKNANDLVTAVIENNTDNIKAALAADAAAFATLGISEEKTPDLAELYNEKYENTLEDFGLQKSDIISIIKKRGIEIPETPKKADKAGAKEPGQEGEPIESDIEISADTLAAPEAADAALDVNALKEAAEEAADKVADKIGEYTGGEVKEEEVDEAPVPEVLPYVVVEEKPTFNGGDANQFVKWINENFVYPQGAKDRGVQGRVLVNFKVGTDGQVKDVVVTRKLDPEIDAEAVRVIKSSPAWTVGKQNGVPVEVSYSAPIICKLQ